MLDEKQQATEVKGINAADVVVLLQIIQRLVGAGAIQDQELAVVGTARNNLVAALQEATGVNFDMARAAQVRAQQEAQRKMQAAQQAAQRPPEPPAPTGENVTPVAVEVAEPTAEETAEAPAE